MSFPCTANMWPSISLHVFSGVSFKPWPCAVQTVSIELAISLCYGAEKCTNKQPNISAIVPRVSWLTSFSLNQTRPLVLKTVWTDGRPLTQLSNLTSNLSSRVLLTSVDKLVLLSTSSIPLPCVPCYQAVMFSNRTSTDFFSVLQSVSSNFPEHFKRVS